MTPFFNVWFLRFKQDCGTFPIFGSPSKWKAAEEAALLEAVELYGFGNWNDIADFVGTQSAQEVKEHFINYYVYGNIGKNTWDAVREQVLDIKDHTCDEDRPLSPSLVTPLPEIPELSPIKQQQLGYMANRDDFEREFDNEAESLISFLSISNEDDGLECDLKSAHIDIYKRRLTERFRRKTVVREYKLVDQFFKQLHQDQSTENVNTVPTKAEKKEKKFGSTNGTIRSDSTEPVASEGKLRIFSQFQSEAEQQLLLQNLQREQLLKQKLKELQKQRKNSLKKTNNIENSSKPKLGKKKENKKAKVWSMIDWFWLISWILRKFVNIISLCERVD